MDGPLSIRKHELRPEILRGQRAAINEMLIYRSEFLHTRPGDDPVVAPGRLAVSRFVSHLYAAEGSDLVLCVWAWLNDGSKLRTALKASREDTTARLEWHRCKWPLNGGRASGR